MAASASSLEDDLSCSVCCDIFREPVLLACGHSFCRECLSRHWSCSPGRRCPVCRRPSPQEPLLNISLRSTCESFLQQQQQRDANEAQRRKKKEEEEEEKEEEEMTRLCPEHNQRLAFFCEKEQQLICSQCKKNGHKGHRVLSIQKAVKERKAKLATAMTPLKQRLDLLTSGTTQSSSGIKDIKSQIEDTERKMKKDFAELHKFLVDEEADRLSALRQEAESCSSARKDKTDGQIFNLSQKLKDLEEKMEAKNAIGFLQNFDSILNRAQSPEPEFDLPPLSGVPSMSLIESRLNINVARHLGNLKFRVWEKMKGRAPYYPVTLDPNAHLCFLTLSDDLTSVSRVDKEWCLGPVPGSEGIADDNFHSWDVDVGDKDAEWMLGLMTHRFIHGLLPVCPETGFWAVQRSGGEFQALTAVTSVTGLHLTRRPRVVRVQLWRPLTLRDRSTEPECEVSGRPERHRDFQVRRRPVPGARLPVPVPHKEAVQAQADARGGDRDCERGGELHAETCHHMQDLCHHMQDL
ncbi:zinc-binding protein A33-like [Alosa pseudoharengus]|uniref:zinc-binding protein A33-like n=1 Tax=Alosa pseudoharengus TaxID=34774 RepID=UPI003F899894